MLKLEARPQPSKLMSLLSPLLALVLTALIAALLFVALGKDPVRGLGIFFVEPLQQPAPDQRGGCSRPRR